MKFAATASRQSPVGQLVEPERAVPAADQLPVRIVAARLHWPVREVAGPDLVLAAQVTDAGGGAWLPSPC